MTAPRPAHHPAPPPRSAWQAMVGACAKTLARANPAAKSLGPLQRLDAGIALAVRHNDEKEFYRLLVDSLGYLPNPSIPGIFLELPLSIEAALALPSPYYAKALLSAGADPNQRLPSRLSHPSPVPGALPRPLHRAALDNRHDLLELLLSYGADPNLVDQYRQTPLFIAAGSSAFACVQSLLAAGARPDIHAASGRTPLNASLSIFPTDDPAFVSNFFTPEQNQRFLEPRLLSAAHAPLLLNAGADPNGGRRLTPPMPGRPPAVPPLLAAIRLRDETLAKSLLERGADASCLAPIVNDHPSSDQRYISAVAHRIPEVALTLDSARRFAALIAAAPKPQPAPEPAPAPASPPAEPCSDPAPLARKILSRRDSSPLAPPGPKPQSLN